MRKLSVLGTLIANLFLHHDVVRFPGRLSSRQLRGLCGADT